jgi:hypothetical protein
MVKKSTSRTKKTQSQEIEINFGRITYLSLEKGAFVELITSSIEQSVVSEASTEIFVPKELIETKKNLDKDSLVQLTRVGDTIIDIEPF